MSGIASPALASTAPVGGATASNQTDGSQKTQIVDAGGEAATVTGGKLDVNASIDTTGLATSARQDTGNTSLASIVTNTTGVSTSANQSTEITSLQLIDDVVYASDAAISKVAGIGAQFDDVSPGTTTENSVRALRMSTRRELYTTIRDAAGNERGLNVDANGGIPITIESAQTLATVTTVTTLTNVGAGNAAATIAADGVTPTVPGIAAYGFVKTPGANTWDRHYSVVNATDTTGTGIAAAGILAQFDDVSPGTVTENRFGNVRMSVRREVYTQIRDAAGNERGLNIDSNGFAGAVLQTQTDTTMVGGVNVKEINGVAPLMGVGATGTGAQRIVIANGTGRTLVSAGGQASSSGNNTLVAAGTNRLKVYAFSLSTVSTTSVTCIFQDGASGTTLWRVVLQTPANVAGGANLVVQPPAWIFATSSATLLNLNLSAAVAVDWSVAYYDEA